MNNTNYKILYEQEKQKREEIQEKCNKLIAMIQQIPTLVNRMNNAAHRIEMVMNSFKQS